MPSQNELSQLLVRGVLLAHFVGALSIYEAIYARGQTVIVDEFNH